MGTLKYAPMKPMTIPAMIPTAIPLRSVRCMSLGMKPPRRALGVERRGATRTLQIEPPPATPQRQTLHARRLPHLRPLQPRVPLCVAHGEVHVAVPPEANELATLGELHAIDHLTLLVDDEIDRAGVADRTRRAHPQVALEVTAR